ncbi:MAG: hypothetical protein M3132_10240 [Actinomycetia bacterium]|nr:hypothetical protein [Actinomycetes bacterium]
MTMTTTDQASTRERLSMWRAVLGVIGVATVLAVSGCTTSGSTDTTDAPSTSLTTATEQSTATTVASTTNTTPIDARSVLDAALERYTEGYQFESLVTIREEEAAAVTGIVIDATAQMDVVSGDGTASYLTTPEGSWVRIEGGDWQEVESDGPFDAPLGALASPTSLTVIGSGADGLAIVGIYDESAFTTEEPVELKMIFKDGLLINASYTTGEATVTTSFGALDGATIEDPTTPSA